MDNNEYEKLYNLEKEHWFYKGKRDIVLYWLKKYINFKKTVLHADIGTGSGIFTEEMSGNCKSFGVEYSDFSLKNFRRKNINLIRSSILKLPFKESEFDCVTSLDVLEHLEDDKAALKELVRITKQNGIIIINVPAFNILWSDWDVTLHHKRRYTVKMFKKIIDAENLSIIKLFYINNIMFIPVLIYRLLNNIFHFKSRMEDSLPDILLNRFLEKIYTVPAKWDTVHFPFGISLFAVLRKK